MCSCFWQRLASSMSWVTITRVMSDVLLREKRMLSTLSLVAVSRFPVGSSAKIMLGLFTRARAITVRCFCPPDSAVALFLALSAISSCSRASMPRFLRSVAFMFAIFSGSTTFSSTVALGVRKNCWNTNPKVLFLSLFSSVLLSFSASIPFMFRVPLSCLSSRASMCIRVDFPEPLFPTMARESFLFRVRETPFRAWKAVSFFP